MSVGHSCNQGCQWWKLWLTSFVVVFSNDDSKCKSVLVKGSNNSGAGLVDDGAHTGRREWLVARSTSTTRLLYLSCKGAKKTESCITTSRDLETWPSRRLLNRPGKKERKKKAKRILTLSFSAPPPMRVEPHFFKKWGEAKVSLGTKGTHVLQDGFFQPSATATEGEKERPIIFNGGWNDKR